MLKSLLRFLFTALVLAAACAAAYLLWKHYQYSPWTRDARVRADVIAVAPDISGIVTQVHVTADQRVRRGDAMFAIDAERYRLAVEGAKAALQAADAEMEQKLDEARRREHLDAAIVSRESRTGASAAAQAARARVAQAHAELASAELNLARTAVRAPVDGYVTNLTVQAGDYATAGHPLVAVVDEHSFRIDGYFEETKIRQLQVGDPVDIRMLGGGGRLSGHVQSIARAIADAEDAGLLSNVNPTFHWVRLAQRIPVRIALDSMPEDMVLSAGMTCTVTVHPPRARAPGDKAVR